MTILCEMFWWGLCIGIAGSAIFCRIVRKHFQAWRRKKVRDEIYK